MKEIEIKILLENREKLESFLEKNGDPLFQNISQKDIYFTPSHRDFYDERSIRERIRIRETDKESFITYKKYQSHNGEYLENDYAEELEFSIENALKAEQLFNVLNFKEVVRVEKSRSGWMYKDIEVVIDQVRNLGLFAEFELKKEVGSPSQGLEELRSLIKEIGLENCPEQKSGYSTMMLNQQK